MVRFFCVYLLFLLSACGGGTATYPLQRASALYPAVQMVKGYGPADCYIGIEEEPGDEGVAELFFRFSGENGDSLHWVEGVLRLPVKEVDTLFHALPQGGSVWQRDTEP